MQAHITCQDECLRKRHASRKPHGKIGELSSKTGESSDAVIGCPECKSWRNALVTPWWYSKMRRSDVGNTNAPREKSDSPWRVAR